MKKTLLLFIILLGVLDTNVFAQNFNDIEDGIPVTSYGGSKVFLRAGLTAGATMSKLSTTSDLQKNFGFRPGFTAGGFFNIRFLSRNVRSTAETGILALQPEVRYTSIGGNSSDSNIGLSYLMIPVMLQVYPAANFYVEVGPAVGLNISHTPNNIVLSGVEYNLDKLKANDVAAVAGLGYYFGNFGVGARYYMGFSELAKNMPWKNSWFEVGISYAFPLTKKQFIID